jgi:hypothetical protein
MDLIYSRTIAIHRPKSQAIAGPSNVATLVGYTGETIDTAPVTGELVIFAAIPAAVQFISPLTRSAGSTLPTDTHAPGAWKIFIRAADAPKGSIVNRDIVIDDLNNRYQVEDAYWTTFGYNLRARLLEI